MMTTNEFSPALKVASVLGGVIALLVAIKIGRVMIKLLLGLSVLRYPEKQPGGSRDIGAGGFFRWMRMRRGV